MHPKGMRAKPLNLSSVFFMLSAPDSNERGQRDWLFSSSLNRVFINTWIYFDIQHRDLKALQ